MPSEALEIVVDKESPRPVYTVREMVDALTAYRELQAALDRAMPDQIIRSDDKPFRKKQYWRAVAQAFNLAVELVAEHRDVYGMLEGGAENYGYRVTYRAATKGGRSSIGDGTCTAAEKSRGRMRATEHNVRSHAHTRAMNRAISNLCAFGEVSAEEIDEDVAPKARLPKAMPRAQTAPDPDPGEAAPEPDPTPATATKAPANFKAWLHALRQAAERGDPALRQAWADSDSTLKKYLRDNDAEAWLKLKQRALRVTAQQREPGEDE